MARAALGELALDAPAQDDPAVDGGTGPLPRQPERRLFDFGPDIERPESAPVAAIPPWMRDEAPADAPDDVATGADDVAPGPVEPEPDPDPDPDPDLEPEAELVADPDSEPEAAAAVEPVTADLVTAPAVLDVRQVGPADATLRSDGPAVRLRPRKAPRQAAATIETPPAPTPAPAPAPAAKVRAGASRWRVERLVRGLAIVMAGGAIGILAAGGLPAGGSDPVPSGPAALAAAWVLENASGETGALVPDSMTAGLADAGLSVDRVVGYGGDSGRPPAECCDLLVVAGPAQGEIADGLPAGVRAAFDRSRLLASFAAADGRAEVRQVLPGSASEVAADLAADRKARVAAGREIARTERIELSDVARRDLIGGLVDPRVLIALVGVSGRHEVSVAAFPAQPGEDGADILRRGVQIATLDGAEPSSDGIATTDVLSFLGEQDEPYRPTDAALRGGAGGALLELGYPAAGPLGLLTLGE